MPRKRLDAELPERIDELEHGEIDDATRSALQEMKDDIAAYRQKQERLSQDVKYVSGLFAIVYLLQSLNTYYPSNWSLALLFVSVFPIYAYGWKKWL